MLRNIGMRSCAYVSGPELDLISRCAALVIICSCNAASRSTDGIIDIVRASKSLSIRYTLRQEAHITATIAAMVQCVNTKTVIDTSCSAAPRQHHNLRGILYGCQAPKHDCHSVQADQSTSPGLPYAQAAYMQQFSHEHCLCTSGTWTSC